MIQLLSIFLAAFLFRIRGDSIVATTLGWPSATFVGRLIWAMPLPIIFAFYYGDWRILLLAPALLLGTFPGWYGGIDLGKNDSNWLKNIGIMSLRGLWWIIGCVPILYLTGHSFFLVGAALLLCPLSYFLASLVSVNFNIGALALSSNDGNVNVPLGEMLFGASCGAILSLSLIMEY